MVKPLFRNPKIQAFSKIPTASQFRNIFSSDIFWQVMQRSQSAKRVAYEGWREREKRGK
jgi:hypothetical protein